MIARAHRFPTNPGPGRTLGFIGPASASGRTLQCAERFFGVLCQTPKTHEIRFTIDERVRVRRAPSFAFFPIGAAKARRFGR